LANPEGEPVVEILYSREPQAPPDVTFVLLDWSCRESYHTLDYLARQSLPRSRYEVIWIEYYQKRSPEIAEAITTAEASSKPAPLDKWVVMDVPPNVYYHKHLMYNVGIVLARGRVMVFCDSDAVVSPTFVESIIRAFEEDTRIVLHLDQVRNDDRRFHPFNYPSVEEIVGPECVNWRDGKPLGLVDKSDPLHTRNYGACMAALRADLIAIGGADEHLDYLGHICGPYEMTFRLINAGRREVWHQSEWLYHVWHPGQAGDKNISGPHDGRHMSLPALEVRTTGRVMPMVENPAIRMLRLGRCEDGSPELLDAAARQERLDKWRVNRIRTRTRKYDTGRGTVKLRERADAASRYPRAGAGDTVAKLKTISRLRLAVGLLGLLPRQVFRKVLSKLTDIPDNEEKLSFVRRLARLAGKIPAFPSFTGRQVRFNSYLARRCLQCLDRLANNGAKTVALWGGGDAAAILCTLDKSFTLEVRAIVFPWQSRRRRFRGRPVRPASFLGSFRGPVIVASLENTAEHVSRLRRLGVGENRITLLE